MHAHQIVKFLFHLLWRKFDDWLVDQNSPEDILSGQRRQVVQDFGQQLFSQKSFDTSNLQGSLEFHMLYQVFCQITVSSQSPVAKLWLLYFHMVQLLFNYTQSLKIADRNLHLISL